MTSALLLIVGLLQGGGDALLIPQAPDRPPVLAQVVWPALSVEGPRGHWSPKPLERRLGDPGELARDEHAAGVLWAVERGGVVFIRLYRAEDARYLEVEVGREDAPSGALAQATRLQLNYLLSAPRSGGRPWYPARLRAPKIAALDAVTIAEFEPPATSAPPDRARPNVPTLAAPAASRPNEQTTLLIERRPDDQMVHPWRVGAWVALGVRTAADLVAPALGVGFGFPLAPSLGARFEVDYTHDTQADVGHGLDVGGGVELQLWDGTVPGLLIAGARYQRLAIDDEDAQRGAFFAGLGLQFQPESAVTVDMDLVVGASPWDLNVAGQDPYGAVDVLLRLRLGYRSLRAPDHPPQIGSQNGSQIGSGVDHGNWR